MGLERGWGSQGSTHERPVSLRPSLTFGTLPHRDGIPSSPRHHPIQPELAPVTLLPEDPENVARSILESTREREAEWVALVMELAELESPSTDPASQRAVQDVVTRELERLGYHVRIHGDSPTDGGMLLARREPWPKQIENASDPLGLGASPPGSYQLLVGHTDTVWPHGTLQTMPVERENDVLRGPGVFDMKGGIAQGLLALRVLHGLKLTPGLEPIFFLNTDEEIGSMGSTPTLQELARRAARVLVLEPALGREGRIKTARKGTGGFLVRVLGRSAHAGLAPEEGASAILELAHCILHIQGLARPDIGTDVNMGTVQGGERPNVVASRAQVEVDVRVSTLAEGRRLEAAVYALASADRSVPGTRVEVEGAVDRPPLERTPGNRILWDQAQESARALGLEVTQGFAGGASDGNTTSLLAPTLDGLGAVGDGAHALHEHLLISASLDRAALLAGLLMLPPSHGKA